MTAANWITIAGIFFTLLLAGVGGLIWIVRSMATFETILNLVLKDVKEIRTRVDSFAATCFTKEEAETRLDKISREHVTMWGRIDACKKWIRQLFFKNGENLDDEDL